jgi:hypothetical protein
MTVCHSLWIRPFKENRFGIEYERQLKVSLYLAAVSLLYLKNNGCYTKFYGDEEAVELFKVLPYDEFIVLNIPENTNTQFWA